MSTGPLVPGDPGGTSALGGALRSQALRLRELLDDLEQAARRTARARSAHRAGGPIPHTDHKDHTDHIHHTDHTQHAEHADQTALERDLLARTATELDRVGGLLQAWTASVAEDGARLRSLAAEVERAGLVIDGHLVVEPTGPSRADPAERLRHRQHLQELLNRVTAGRARELARLGRELAASSVTLAGLSERARSGT
jgi:hypothetical protein